MYNKNVYLLLGTNLGNKIKNIELAQQFISQRVGEIKKKSKILETDPIGFESSQKFLNQILFIETKFSPMQLLEKTQTIEKIMGRTAKTKKNKYQDRIIDIDILLYEKLHYYCEKLEIPHQKNLMERAFVSLLLDKL